MKGKKMENWNKRWSQLNEEMEGFDSLIDTVQGLLVGYSIATGEIWCTISMEDTIYRARKIMNEMVEMTDAWGIEK